MVLSARVYRPLFGVVIFFTFTLAHAQNIIGPVGEPSGGFEDYSISCPDGEFLVGLLATATLTVNGNEPLFWSVRATNNCGEAGEFSAANAINAPGQGDNIIAGVDYRPLCAVYKDDRCSVCHGGPTPAGHPVAFPSQNDAQARFNDDTCNTCHYVVHPETSQNVWEFPPGSAEEQVGVDLQTFADPATCGDICRTVRNWAEEHDFIHHIEDDPLVKYGFEPDTAQGPNSSTLNAKPPVAEMDHAGYVSLSASWYRAGMPCDPINNDFPSAAVSGAGNSGSDSSGGSGAQRFDTSILDKIVEPPKGEPLWWIRGTKQPLKSGNPTDVGELPPA